MSLEVFGNRLKKILLTAIVMVSVNIASAGISSAQEITAIDFNGDLIGKVIPDGKVVSYDNQLIGNVTADSLIMNFDGNLIGGVVPQGVAIGNDAKLLGKVSNDGSVRVPSGKIIGKVLPNGLVINDYFDVIGSVLFPGLVYSDEGKTVGRLTGDGLYTNLRGQSVGFITPDGYAYRRVGNDYVLDGRLISSKMVVSLYGEFIGSVVPGGGVSDFDGEMIGSIKANGFVYDEKNKIIGRIVKSGYAFNNYGTYIGFVSYNGEVINKDQLVGKMRADGNIVNDSGEVIGYSIDISATATDFQGRYLGRILPEGNFAKNKEISGSVGARGSVLDKDGNVIGKIIETGPVFDYKASLSAHALNNGTVISLLGNTVGYMKGNQAYDASGRIMGASLDSKIVVDLNNQSSGLTGIGGSVSMGENKKYVSPYGYVFSTDGNISGSALSLQPLYSIVGANIAYITPNGEILNKSSSSIGKLTQSGIAVDERNRILGKNIDFVYALNKSGLISANLSENNFILDKNKKIIAKVLPDGSVVSTTSDNSAELMPKVGNVYNEVVVSGFDGNVLGYANIDGVVRNASGSNIGKLVERGIAVDNNGTVMGEVVPFASVVDERCELIGVITPRGDVRNYREINVGRYLLNGQVVSENEVVVGHAVSERGAIDYNGNIAATISANGQAVNYNGESIGCVDKRGLIQNSSKTAIASIIDYNSVIDFNDNIIGRTILDGNIVDANNQFIGYVQPNTNANSKTGAPIGGLFKYKYAFSNDNRLLGRVLSDSSVVDERASTVGNVNFDGTVVSGGQKIGYALYDLYVYDNNFNTIGYISANGSVLSLSNRNIGEINKGFLIDKAEKVIGRGNRDFYIRDKSNIILGELQLNDEVTDNKGIVVGKLNLNGEVNDNKGAVIAIAKPLQYFSKITPVSTREKVLDNNGNIIGEIGDFVKTAVDDKGNIIGTIDKEGKVLDFDGNLIGTVDAEKGVVDAQGNVIGKEGEMVQTVIDKDGKVIGTYQQSNEIVDDAGTVIGTVGKQVTSVKDDSGKTIGYVDDNGDVVDLSGIKIGTLGENGQVVDDKGTVIARTAEVVNLALDKDNKVMGVVQKDGTVVNKEGKVIGKRSTFGKVLDRFGKIMGKILNREKVFDSEGKLVGYAQSDGTVVNEDGKVVGKLNPDGTVTNANGNIIGGIGVEWYEKTTGKRPSGRDYDTPQVGVSGEKTGDGKYRKSLNIALTPDGEYLGDILDDGRVVDKKGNVLGHKMPDGLVIDDSGNLIGIEEVKKPGSDEIFVPTGSYGKGGAYGTGTGPGDTLGPGGGYGPGERYDSQRAMALSAAQQERRTNISVGKISTNIKKESFDGMQKDWEEQGVNKVISSWRVDMSEMILSDKPIPAVIARSIDSNNPTPVTAYVERNVYAEEGRNVLIPAGSRLIGTLGGVTASTEATSESAKISITWSRLLRPDGSMFTLQGSITGDAQGRGGALGYLDQQLFKKYATPIMTTTLTSLTSYYMAPKDEESGEGSDTESPRQQAANDARQNFLDDMNEIFKNILNDKASIKPMTYVPAGTRIIVYPNVDLWLRTVERDKDATTSKGYKDVLIDDDAKNKEREYNQANRAAQVNGTGGGSSSSVVYSADDPNVEAANDVPLLADNKSSDKKKTVTAPPPPPPSFAPSGSSGGSSGARSSGGSSNKGTTNSDSVPQLF